MGQSVGGPKIFCVGAGKTGTTSLEAFFKSLGFTVGDQETGELLLEQWAVRNFQPVIALAESAQVFQDMPFNCPFTFQAMDSAFPNSKFILSVRNDAEEWFHSLARFHTSLIGKRRLPTPRDLRSFPYRYEGWILDALIRVYGVTEEEPYHKETLMTAYERHNQQVKAYFRYRPQSLLVVNLVEPDAVRQVVEFVGLPYRSETMPHLNRSE